MFLKYKGIIFALCSGLFFGLIGYFGISVIHSNISVYSMLFWRFTVSGLFIALLLLPQLQTINKTKQHPKELLKVVLYGVFFYGICSILYFLAAQYIGSGLAMVIFFTYPALVMLINKLYYKTSFSLVYGFSLLIIFIGMFLLIHGQYYSFKPVGILFSALSALFYASYIFASKKSPVSPLLSTMMLSLGCMITCFIAAEFDHSFFIPATLQDWFNIFGIGIICTALPILLLLKGLKHISATQASILSVLEPVFVVLFGIILLGEQVTFTQSLGVSVILAGSLLSLLNDSGLPWKR